MADAARLPGQPAARGAARRGGGALGEAARIYLDCWRKGITVRSTIDCFIAALVLEAEHTLLHDDDDFQQIARVRPLATLRG